VWGWPATEEGNNQRGPVVTKHPNRPKAQRTSSAKMQSDPISPDLQVQIGRRLKSFYDSVATEPIPDRFTRLLEQLGAEPEQPVAPVIEPAAKTGT
jgi:hypothetical protein